MSLAFGCTRTGAEVKSSFNLARAAAASGEQTKDTLGEVRCVRGEVNLTVVADEVMIKKIARGKQHWKSHPQAPGEQ